MEKFDDWRELEIKKVNLKLDALVMQVWQFFPQYFEKEYNEMPPYFFILNILEDNKVILTAIFKKRSERTYIDDTVLKLYYLDRYLQELDK